MPPKPPPAPRPTHFLCIPLVTVVSRPQLSSSLASFHADVTNPSSFGVPRAAVRPLGTLHLTLGVMSFMGDETTTAEEKLGRASELLRGLRLGEMLGAARKAVLERGRVAGGEAGGMEGRASGVEEGGGGEDGKGVGEGEKDPIQKLTVSLKGLKSMQPAKDARVLYAPPVDKLGDLYGFCERLRGIFLKSGLMTDEARPLLLHATIVNMVYAKAGAKGGRHGKPKTLDARGILDRYEEYEWMEDVPVEKVQICKMGAKEMENGEVEYEAVAEVLF